MKTIIKAALTLCVGICVSCVDLYQEPRSVLTPETIEYNERNMEGLQVCRRCCGVTITGSIVACKV